MNLIFNMRIPFLIQDCDAGSTVDREASDKERQKDIPTFKDNDFLNDRIKISIGEDAKVPYIHPGIQFTKLFLRGSELTEFGSATRKETQVWESLALNFWSTELTEKALTRKK